MLRSLKKQPNPAEAVQSNYYARVDEELCTGCETCVDRCQMEAIDVIDAISTIALNRCIGCGLCVSTCPEEAISLKRKQEKDCVTPPKDEHEWFNQRAIMRGVDYSAHQ